jgi:quercetin dioxygenase-like cupin family protein
MERIFAVSLVVIAALAGFAPTGGALADDALGKASKVTVVFEQDLPNVPGKKMKVVLVEYGPGGFSPGHTHPESAFIYARVLQGAMKSQVNDGPVETFQAGEAFTELPGSRHSVSANASETEDAKLLAVFVVDSDEDKILTPFAE